MGWIPLGHRDGGVYTNGQVLCLPHKRYFNKQTLDADLTSFKIAVRSASIRILVIADRRIFAASDNVLSLVGSGALLFSSVFNMETIVLHALLVASHDSYISSEKIERHFD